MVEWTDTEKLRATSEFFLKHSDQDWSFTDCLSFDVMKHLCLQQSLTKDVHFRDAGFHPLLIG